MTALALTLLTQACTVDATGVVSGGEMIFDAAVPPEPSEPADVRSLRVMDLALKPADGGDLE